MLRQTILTYLNNSACIYIAACCRNTNRNSEKIDFFSLNKDCFLCFCFSFFTEYFCFL